MKWWMDRKTLNDYIVFAQPLPTSGGLFYTKRTENPPWGNDAGTGSWLDALYMTSRGEKYVSNLVTNLASEPPLTARNMQTLSGFLMLLFRDKWTRVWEIVTAEYNPIENYRMVEHEEFANGDRTNRTIVTQGDVYGFNSSSPSPATRETESENGSTIDREGERELTRSGNIGVTTSQQMIQSSIDLYNNWLYFENVFQDVDSILTIPIY